jgi:hypothetical protein
LDGEAIPEVLELAIADGHLHGLALLEVRRLEFVLLLKGAFLVLLVVSKRARHSRLKKAMSPR